jgi:hypothetical protein
MLEEVKKLGSQGLNGLSNDIYTRDLHYGIEVPEHDA